VQAEGGQPVGEQEATDEDGDRRGGQGAAAIGGKERQVEDVRERHARHGDEEQRRQGDEIDEAVERLAAGVAEEAETAAEIAGEDDAEYRQDDIGDREHGGTMVGFRSSVENPARAPLILMNGLTSRRACEIGRAVATARSGLCGFLAGPPSLL
jgi:hypothetical protein